MAEQSQQVVGALRKLIIDRVYRPGERVAELDACERLGVSRTPVRIALRVLEQEGLLVSAGGRGYLVREISLADIRDGIEVRGVLEGLAARRVAEAGMSRNLRSTLLGCLAEGDAIFAESFLSENDITAYHDMNMRFHRAILDESDSRVIADAVARNEHLPLASSSSIAIDPGESAADFRRLQLAHLQHHIIYDALEAGEGARAEAMMREHAHAALRYIEMFGEKTPDPEQLQVITSMA